MEFSKSRSTTVLLKVMCSLLIVMFIYACYHMSGSVTLRTLWVQDEVRHRLRGPISPDDPRVLDILRREHLVPPSTKPYNLKNTTFGDVPFILDNIKKLFGDQRGGFFVESGAFDGEIGSNTLRLERELGWTGLLIEANPENYQMVTTKHRKAWISFSCLSTENHPKEEVIVSLREKNNAAERRWSSYLVGVKLNTTIYDGYISSSNKTYYAVQCFPLASYLLALKVSTVDFLSLDIQGAEKSVLKNIPWDRITIRAMVVEEVHFKDFNHQFVDDMKNRGFVLIGKNGFDYFFVKGDDPIMKKVQAMPIPPKN